MTTATQLEFGKTYGGSAPENYERFFVPAIGEPLARDLVRSANLAPGERVLDVACGTGIVARLAAREVRPNGAVAGLDINAEMLKVARAVSAELPIDWHEGAAESMRLADESFDVVFCQMGVQFMPDKSAALREMRRVVRSGGRVLVNVPTPNPLFDVLETVMARHLPAARAFVSKVFSLNDAAEIEGLFRTAGFSEVTTHQDSHALRLPMPREFLWQYVSSTPLAGALSAAGAAVADAIEREVVAEWQPWVRDGGISHEQPVIVATARK
jgi:ubiquinone/menaquinone biosynthesis C-methylase UbiE